MRTRLLREGAEKVYNAAQEWIEQALRRDGSLFTPGKNIWSSHWLGQLHQRFLNNPDESRASFDEKLRRQLDGSPQEVYQLMAEVLYIHFLVAGNMTSATKQARINQVLGWGPTRVEIPAKSIESLGRGILNPGTAFNTYRPFQVGLIIEFVEQLKGKSPDEREQLLNDPWKFKAFLMGIRLVSNLLRNNQGTPRIQRQALLHLVHPNTFEAMVNTQHKERIVGTFSTFAQPTEEDLDLQLQQIRLAIEPTYGSRDHFFYMDAIRTQWDPTYKPECVSSSDNPWFPTNITALAQDLLWQPNYLQEIIEDLQEKRQVIFYGPPGTGKTYVAREIANQCRLNGGDFEIVQFHPSYSYEDFVEGYRPTLTDAGQPAFKLVQGPLRRIADKARVNPDATFILIIDELNRGNVAKVFGELYFLIEYRAEEMQLQYGGEEERFSLPSNLWFICTMNTADRSIALMDAALRRRFYFAPFFPNEPPIEGLLRRWLVRENQDTLAADLVDEANKKLERDMGIGPSYFMGSGQTLDETRVQRIWDRAVIPYIEEQFFGDENKLAEFRFDRLKRQLTPPTATGEASGQAPANAAPDTTPDNDDNANTC